MAHIFISYSRKDEAFAHQLADDLDIVGGDIVWIDVEDIPAGIKWIDAIQDGLDACDVMILIITPDSMQSRNVADEWQYYLDHPKPVIPILLKPSRIHFRLKPLQYIDFYTQNYDTAFAQLHAALRRKGITLAPLSSHDPIVPISSRPAIRSRRVYWATGAVVLITLIGIAALLLLNGGDGNNSKDSGAAATQAAALMTEPPTQDPLQTLLAQYTQTAVARPTETAIPTQTPNQTATQQYWETRAAEIVVAGWTDTPTPGPTEQYWETLTARAVVTLWRDTPSPMFTPSITPPHTPTEPPTPTITPPPTNTPVPSPTETISASVTAAPSSTPIPTAGPATEATEEPNPEATQEAEAQVFVSFSSLPIYVRNFPWSGVFRHLTIGELNLSFPVIGYGEADPDPNHPELGTTTWIQVQFPDSEGWVATWLPNVSMVSTSDVPLKVEELEQYLGPPQNFVTKSSIPIPTNTPSGSINAQIWPEPTIQSFDGVDMVYVPAGCFMMGSDDGYDDEKPVHEVCLDAFWMDRTEVTNGQFAVLDGQAASASYWTGANRPRERITWGEARNFCESRGARLPTEAEWEYAARGPEGLIYPWGNTFVADNVVYSGNSGGQTANVGSKPGGVSWVGALDLSGNVWEWTADWYDAGYYATPPGGTMDPTSPASGTYRVLRGGSWYGNYDSMRAAYRSWYDPDGRSDDIGFRCTLSR